MRLGPSNDVDHGALQAFKRGSWRLSMWGLDCKGPGLGAMQLQQRGLNPTPLRVQGFRLQVDLQKGFLVSDYLGFSA